MRARPTRCRASKKRRYQALRHTAFALLWCLWALALLAIPCRAEDYLHIRGDANYPPYEYLDNGIPTGFNVDILRAVARAMGLDIRIDLGTWNEVRTQLEAGEIDGLTGMYFSEERDRLVDFSSPHILVTHAIFVRKDSAIQSLEDLAGKSVLVQNGDIMHEFARENLPDSTIVAAPSQVQALEMLAAGEYDAALLSRLQNLFYAKDHGLNNITTAGPPIAPREYCFAVPEGDVELAAILSEGLAIVRNSGEYDKIYDNWFGSFTYRTMYDKIIRYAVLILAPVVAFIIFITIWSWSLKRRVRMKTSELTAELGERQRTEAVLARERRRLGDIVDGTGAGTWEWHVDKGEVIVNERWANMLGYSLDEIMPLTNEDFKNLEHPEDIPRIVEKLNKHFSGKIDHLAMEHRLRHKSGEWIWVQVRGRLTARDEQGTPLVMSGITVDVTERKRAEQELRSLRNYLVSIIDSMPSILVGVDTQGRITQWNKAAEQATGVHQAQAMHQHLPALMPGLASRMDSVQSAMRDLKPVHIPKATYLQKGETRYLDVDIYPLLGGQDEHSGAVIRVDDVTERVRMEELMIQNEKMMSVGGLAAGMAHEINNPLAGVLGLAQNIEKRLFGDITGNKRAAEECGISLDSMHCYLAARNIDRSLQGIVDSGRRAATIVRNMLSFSRKQDKQLRPHDLAELMDTTIDLASNDYDLKKKYDFRQIEIVRDYESNMPRIMCEGNEIQQVFFNLLKNGAEAMAENPEPREPPRFIVRIRSLGGKALVSIEDNGPGMSVDVRKRIFEPFFTTKGVGKGTGLGLAISYFIITDQHQGRLSVFSAPDRFTRFEIELPLDDYQDG